MREQYDRLIGGSRLIHQLRRLVCESDMTAVLGEDALSPSKAVGVREQCDRLVGASRLSFTSGHEYCSAIPQSRQAISTALYRDTRLTQTALLGDPPYCKTPRACTGGGSDDG